MRSGRARSQFSSVSLLRKHALGTSALPVLFCFSLTQTCARDERAPSSLLFLSYANMRSGRARSQFSSVSLLRKHALGTSALPVLFCFSLTQTCARDERAPSSLLFLSYANMRSGRARSQFSSVSLLRKHALGTSALPVLFCFSLTQTCARDERAPSSLLFLSYANMRSGRARSQFSSVSLLRKHALGTSALPVLFCFSLTQTCARDERAPSSLLFLSYANMRSGRALSQFSSVSPLRKHALGTSALPVLFCFSLTQACARDERAPSSLLFLLYASMRSGRARSQFSSVSPLRKHALGTSALPVLFCFSLSKHALGTSALPVLFCFSLTQTCARDERSPSSLLFLS